LAKAAVNEDDKLWTVRDLAAYLNLSVNATYSMYRRQRIPFLRVGGSVRFVPSEVRRWVGMQRGA
jgi:excisionase family DNA binding protein